MDVNSFLDSAKVEHIIDQSHKKNDNFFPFFKTESSEDNNNCDRNVYSFQIKHFQGDIKEEFTPSCAQTRFPKHSNNNNHHSMWIEESHESPVKELCCKEESPLHVNDRHSSHQSQSLEIPWMPSTSKPCAAPK